jgi:hypothetical protein
LGQYWIPVNLDKREFVHPHRLGAGLKLWEQLASSPGTGAALIVLTAAMPEVRGGGDLDLDENRHGPQRTPSDYREVARRTIGRWAGDRIALVGDYAENTDLPAEFEAASIYARCCDDEELDHCKVLADFWESDKAKAFAAPVLAAPFKDVSDDVRRVIEHELWGTFKSDGWCEFGREGEEDADPDAKGAPTGCPA